MSHLHAQIKYTARAIKYKYSKKGFSESGEDFIARYLMGTKKGMYIDIGAGNPVVGSNSYLFYKSGWRGVAVDPNSKLTLSWKLVRPKDKFLPIAIGSQTGTVEFYEYRNDLRSTISPQVHSFYESQKAEFKTSTVRIESLTFLFEKFIKNEENVFLSVDVEGQELDTLNSLDFAKFKPTLIAVENWKLPWSEKNEVGNFLQTKDYRLVAYSGLTAFYMQSHSISDLLESRPDV